MMSVIETAIPENDQTISKISPPPPQDVLIGEQWNIGEGGGHGQRERERHGHRLAQSTRLQDGVHYRSTEL